MACAHLEAVHRRLTVLGLSNVRVIAVSKTHGPQRIRELIDCGQRDFGENRPNEARDKFPLVAVADLAPTALPVYHHIGPLQTGNARLVARLFDWVHGVGSIQSLLSLDSAAARLAGPGAARPPVRFLIQMQLTDEPTKLGGMPERELPTFLESLPENPAAVWAGFMTMGPENGNSAEIASTFRRLRLLRDRWLPNGELSMGMSGDWEIGVQEGATMIRLGTLLFGTRADGPWKPGSAP